MTPLAKKEVSPEGVPLPFRRRGGTQGYPPKR